MNWALAVKAEVVLGLHLVARHRAPRLAVMLALSLVALMLANDPSDATPAARLRTMLLLTGMLSAVAASRLFAQGGAQDSVRRTASPFLLAPAGRLAGMHLFTALPVIGSASILVGASSNDAGVARMAVVLLFYGAAVSALVMAATPVTGASGAAGLGLIASLVGAMPPSEVSVLLGSWPWLRGPAVLLWNVLPLPWRAARWLEIGTAGDAAVLVLWIVVGLVAAGWLVSGIPAPQDARSL